MFGNTHITGLYFIPPNPGSEMIRVPSLEPRKKKKRPDTFHEILVVKKKTGSLFHGL